MTTTYNASTVMTSHYEKVKEFHLMFGHPIRDTQYNDMLTGDDNTIEKRVSFIREEYDEFMEAFEADDRVEMADALCDLAYFVYGAYLCFGFEFVTHNEVYDVNVYNVDDIKRIVRKLDESIVFMENSKEKPSNETITTLKDNLYTSLNITYDLGYGMGFNMDTLFTEVHRSNMTKLCTTEEDAQLTVEKYVEEGKYDTPTYHFKNGYYVVYNESNNKILKSYKWETPQLASLIV